jgi:hypothetical protein
LHVIADICWKIPEFFCSVGIEKITVVWYDFYVFEVPIGSYPHGQKAPDKDRMFDFRLMGGTPKSSILIGFPIINHPAIGVPSIINQPFFTHGFAENQNKNGRWAPRRENASRTLSPQERAKTTPYGDH